MERNCMNCVNREAVVNCQSGRRHYRCSLDREMRVNRRMHCEEWADRVTTAGAAGVAVDATGKVDLDE